jgi:hypothetical protein
MVESTEFTNLKCSNCDGEGVITEKMAIAVVGTLLDLPSLYINGPSYTSRKKASKIVEWLKSEGLDFPNV